MTDVVPLLDAHGSFATLREAFGIESDEPWNLPVRAFLLRSDAWTALVDTGIGPPGEEPFMPDRQGLLPSALAGAGVAPAAVDLVLFTHLHVDHAGWNMVDGAPFFPNARYVAHAADYTFFTSTRPDRPYVRDQLLALHALGRLELFDALEFTPAPGLRLVHVPGHTPGHCILEAGDVTLLGDLAVHELQLADPGLAYVAEEDAAAVAEARRRLLPELAAAGSLVGLGHLPGGLGRVERSGDGFAWRPRD